MLNCSSRPLSTIRSNRTIPVWPNSNPIQLKPSGPLEWSKPSIGLGLDWIGFWWHWTVLSCLSAKAKGASFGRHTKSDCLAINGLVRIPDLCHPKYLGTLGLVAIAKQETEVICEEVRISIIKTCLSEESGASIQDVLIQGQQRHGTSCYPLPRDLASRWICYRGAIVLGYRGSRSTELAPALMNSRKSFQQSSEF